MRVIIALIPFLLILALLPLLSHSSTSYAYLNINYPMWGEVNGTPTLIRPGFYPVGTLIQLPHVNYTYINSSYRLMLVPNATFLVLKGNATIYVTVTPQYLVQVETEYPLNVSLDGVWALINGSFWANESCTVTIPEQAYSISKGERAVLTNPTFFTVKGPRAYVAKWLKEYFVTVNSKYNVTAFINGTPTVLASGWYPQGTKIVTSPYIYLNPFTRLYITPQLNLTLESPIVYSPNVSLQFFVQLSRDVTVPALINGERGYLSSGWYNSGTQVLILVGSAPVSKGVSFFLTSASPALFTVSSYIYVTVSGYYEYYFNISTPVNGTINGIPTLVSSGWYKAGTVITLNSSIITYPNGTGLIIRPNATIILLNSPVLVSVEVMPIYYLNVSSQYPVKALIDGKETYLKSGWFPANTTIVIPFQYFYVNSTFRVGLNNPTTINVVKPQSYVAQWVPQVLLIFNSSYPVNVSFQGTYHTGNSFWVNEGNTVSLQPYYYFSNEERVKYKPITLIAKTNEVIEVEGVKQYLVVINGQAQWVNAGSTITLYSPLPFYEDGIWYGTINVSNGQIIAVNSPLVENLKTTLDVNSFITGWTFIIALLLSGIAMLRYSRRKLR